VAARYSSRLARGGREILGIGAFPGARRWALASLIDSVGTGLLMPLAVLYFTLYVGLRPSSVGLGLTIGGLLALGFGPLAGVLIDALGSKRVLIGCWLLEALAYTGFGLVTNWGEFVVAVTLAQVASCSSSIARNTLVTELVEGDERVRMLASQRSLRNLGYGVGGMLATLALAIGGAAYLVVVYFNAVTYVAAIARVAGMTVPRRLRPVAVRTKSAGGLSRAFSDRRYMVLTVLSFFTTFHASAFEIALPLWTVLHTRAPRALAGILFTINTIVVVLFQVRVSARIRRTADVAGACLRAARLMIPCAGAYLLAHYVSEPAASALLIAGLLAHTVVEMLASAGEWVVSVELADPTYRGTYLSVFNLGNSLQSAVGPVIVTAVLELGNVGLWPLLAALICTGALGTAVIARHTSAGGS
jgi:MFS family permease